MINDFRAKVCKFIPHVWDRKLVPGSKARTDFAWARANKYVLRQETQAEFARPEREAMTALTANNGRGATELRRSISSVALGAPSQYRRDPGAGGYYARRSDGVGAMPSRGEKINDWHQRDGLRAAAVHLQEATRR